MGIVNVACQSARISWSALDDCQLQSRAFSPAINIFLEWANQNHISVYDEKIHSGILRHLYLRYAEKTDELMVCIVANANELRKEKQLVQMLSENLPNLKSIVLNTNTDKTNVITGKKCRTLYGDGYITDILCDMKFRISPLSFYQVNRTQAEKLYQKAAEFANLNKNETLLDMYCGTGTIGLTMANYVKNLIGVEIIPQAVEDAKNNAVLNEISNAEFICADAAQVPARCVPAPSGPAARRPRRRHRPAPAGTSATDGSPEAQTAPPDRSSMCLYFSLKNHRYILFFPIFPPFLSVRFS